MTAPRPRISLIVARARDGAIGRGNAIPWHLSEDLRHFKATTLGHPILMGRRTFESIGRPLPDRRTIVVSRNPAWTHPGCERAGSLDEAIGACAGAPEAFVVGGASLYEAALPLADRLVVTEVELDIPDADTFFPRFDAAGWRRVAGTPAVGRDGIGYRIDTWERHRDASGDT